MSNASEITKHRLVRSSRIKFVFSTIEILGTKMFSIFRLTRRLSPNLKPYSIRQASNLFEPDYLEVSFI